jgi:hypothetical protein
MRTISNHCAKCHEKWVIKPTKNLYSRSQHLASFHLATSVHVVHVGDQDEMIQEVNTFILAVNSKLIISHLSRKYDACKKSMIIPHSGGNDRTT